MNKTFRTLLLVTILSLLFFPVISNAAPLGTMTITPSKTVVHPGTTVDVNFDFGQPLGAYTFEIAYDDSLFEYVSATGGTANDTGTEVIVYFFDTTGGTAPNTGMTVTFRAKAGITTSNPTDFGVTGTGIANPDGTVDFDDITIPIVKDVLVEPDYKDFVISMFYTGTVMPNEEKQVTVNIASPMGRYYDHLRLLASVIKPDGSVVTLKGTDSLGLEHDILDSGWGDAVTGFGLGGAVNQNYTFRALFSKEGTYTLTLSLIDRDDSDNVIATKTIEIPVGITEVLPEELPKTGFNMPLILGTILVLAVTGYAILNKKR